ncbi:MAG: hypothetical protein PHH26_08020 [Candidatus Thermoplasmatota archaeon]|nr:hypothetical protein [Candidatus Thermoplasmatota archaeon]
MDQNTILVVVSLVGAIVSGGIAAYAKYALRNRTLNVISTVFAVIFTIILMAIVWRSMP